MPRARQALGGLVVAGLVVAWLGVTGAARAQTPPGRLPFVTYGPEVGFGPWGVYSLTQDARGLLWVGTDDGLFRHGGGRFEAFSLPAPASTYVRLLTAGLDGAVWGATLEGMVRWHGGALHLMKDTPLRWGMEDGNLVTDGEGRAWAVAGERLYREEQAGLFKLVPGWESRTVQLLRGAGADLYVSTRTALYRLGADGRWQQRDLSAHLDKEGFRLLAAEPQGTAWLERQGQLWAFHFERGQWEARSDALPGRNFTDIAVEGSGVLWAAGPQGLLMAEPRQRLRPVLGVPVDWVREVMVDREGSLWVGGGGLHRLAGRGLWRTYGREEGLPNEMMWAVRRDREGRLWAGTNRGLARATETGWEREPAVPEVAVRNIVLGEDGALWLGGIYPEVFRFEPRTQALQRIPLPASTGARKVYALTFDKEGTLWAATDNGLLYARATGAQRHFEEVSAPGLSMEERYLDLRLDSADRLWVAGYGGLFVLEHGVLRRFSTEEGLRIAFTSSVLERRGGELCVTYQLKGGLSCFRYEGGALRSLTHLDTTHGLSSDIIFVLGEDREGRMWVGTGRGVDLVEGHQVVDHFDTTEGMPSDDCDSQSFLAEPNGDVWVGTSAGLGRFLGGRYGGPLPPPPVVLTSARLGAQELRLGEQAQQVPYQHGVLEVSYAVPGFAAPSRMEREARLVGVDTDWRPVDGQPLRYVDLPPGTYSLELRARYRPGQWGESAHLTFEILPPWWRTALFLLACTLGLVGALGLAVAWRQRALRRRNEALEALVAQRTRELREAQGRLIELGKEATEQRMAGGFAHEVRNVLTGAQITLARAQLEGGVSLCERSSLQLKELYSQVRELLPTSARAQVAGTLREVNAHQARTDAVLRETGALLDRALALTRLLLEYARLGRETPGSEPVRVRALAESVLAGCRTELEARGVEVLLEVAPEAELHAKEVHLYSLLQNLVLNARDALLEQQGQGPLRLRVALAREGERWRLVVEDTGAGITKENLDQIFEPFFTTKPDRGTGLGLGVVRKLVHLYGGTLAVDSALGRGTRFTLDLPASDVGP